MKFSSTSSHRQLHSSTRTIFVFLQIALLFILIAIPSTVSASSSYKFLDTPPAQNVARAGVSVVRLVASYTAVNGKAGQPTVEVQCTSLGVLVASWPQQSNDPNTWILTDGSLVNGSATKNAGAVTCGNLNTTGTLSSLQILLSTNYNPNAAAAPIPLDTDLQNRIFCQNTSDCSKGAALLAFNVNTLFPYVDLSTASSVSATSTPVASTYATSTPVTNTYATSTPTQGNVQPMSTALGLTQNANSSDVPTPGNNNAQHNPDYLKLAETYLTPHLLAVNNANIESGTPLVDANGSLVSMHLNSNSTLTPADIRSFLQAQPALHSIIPQNLVHDSWNTGITTFYQHQYAQAHSAFQQAAKTNPQFQGAIVFAQLAQQNMSTTPAHSTSVGGFRLSNFFIPYWLLSIIGLLFLAVALLISTMLFGHSYQKRRHFQKEIEEANRRAMIEAQRIKDLEVSQRDALSQQKQTKQATNYFPVQIQDNAKNAAQKTNTPPLQRGVETEQSIPATSQVGQATPPDKPIVPTSYQSPTLSCPRCGKPVTPGAKFCPNCRLQLSQDKQSPPLTSISMPARGGTSPVSPWWQESMPPASMEQPQKNQPDVSSSYNQPQSQNNKSESHNIEISPDKPGRAGQRLGSYRLISLLGHGAFAYVYLGEHIYLHTQAAVKVLQN